MINPWEQKKIAGTLFGVVFAYIFAGALYTWFGAPYIEARENCLLQTAAAAEAEVPSGSVITLMPEIDQVPSAPTVVV